MPTIFDYLLVIPARLFDRTTGQCWHRLGHLESTRRAHTHTTSSCQIATTFSSNRPPGFFSKQENKSRPLSRSVLLKTHRFSSSFTRLFSEAPRQDRPRSFSGGSNFGRPYAPQKGPIQSAVGTWTSVIIFGIITGSIYIFAPSSNRTSDIDIGPRERFDQLQAHKYSSSNNGTDMTEEILSGRPGSLTPEQEEKLRLFWIAVLHVFGVLDKEQARNLNGTVKGVVPTLSRQVTPASEKAKKKKKQGWFGRKSKDSDESDVKDASAVDNDDKYGQTAQFKHALANMSPEILRTAFWSMVKHDHPDGLLLRFLRARKWDVEKALVMMVSTMHWRAVEMHVDDDVMVNGEESMLLDTRSADPTKKKWGKDFLEQMRAGKSYLHGTDKAGRPMCFTRVRLHHAGDQTEQTMERYTVYVIELARFLIQPPSDTACVVFDMTGFSMANMDYAPVKFMIKAFEANYPESLGVVLIHKAPWIFQGIWKIIRGLLDPVVANKVHFTNNVDEMETFIEKSRIPKDLGGEEDWELKFMEPVIGENDRMKDVGAKQKIQSERDEIVDEFEKTTITWIENSTNEELKKKRYDLRLSLMQNYWKLDPYVRSRSYYDRIGLIQPGGHLQFYPTSEKADPVPEATLVPAAVPAAVSNGHNVETSADDVD